MHDGRSSELLSQPSFLGIMNISQAIKRYSTGLQIEVFMLWKPRPALDEICEKKLEYKSVTVGALGVPDIRFTGHQRGATNRPNKIGGKFEKTKQNKWIKLMKSKNGGQTNEEKTKQKKNRQYSKQGQQKQKYRYLANRKTKKETNSSEYNNLTFHSNLHSGRFTTVTDSVLPSRTLTTVDTSTPGSCVFNISYKVMNGLWDPIVMTEHGQSMLCWGWSSKGEPGAPQSAVWSRPGLYKKSEPRGAARYPLKGRTERFCRSETKTVGLKEIGTALCCQQDSKGRNRITRNRSTQ